jgi:hypothetical protein
MWLWRVVWLKYNYKISGKSPPSILHMTKNSHLGNLIIYIAKYLISIYIYMPYSKKNKKKSKRNNKTVKENSCLDYTTEKKCHKWAFEKHKYNVAGNPIHQCKWTPYLLRPWKSYCKDLPWQIEHKGVKVKNKIKIEKCPIEWKDLFGFRRRSCEKQDRMGLNHKFKSSKKKRKTSTNEKTIPKRTKTRRKSNKKKVCN